MEFTKKQRTLVCLACLTLSARAHTNIVIVDADFQNGSYNSNSSFEFNGAGLQLSTPPNPVYIHCDDLGFGDTGFNGSQDVFTPALEKLAPSGLRCTAGYVTGPQCGLSRAGMISGMHQARFKYNDNSGRSGLADKAVAKTAPELFKDLGYVNAMIGKWHIGIPGDPNTPLAEDILTGIIAGNNTSVMPWHRGFDYTCVMDGGSCHYNLYSAAGIQWNTARNYDHRNLEVLDGSTTVNFLDLPANTDQTTEFTTRAINLIDRIKNQPFFVYLSYNAPHTPLGPTTVELNANSHNSNNSLKQVAAAMNGVDREVGHLMDYLAARNLLENTIIMFFSDNGGPTSQNHSLNGPITGFKGDILEGGTRVPFLVSSLDYVPSIFHHQGRGMPEHLDGLPLLEDLQGKTSRLANARRFTQTSNSPSGAIAGAVDLFTKITEDISAPSLDPAIVSMLACNPDPERHRPALFHPELSYSANPSTKL